MVEGAVLEEIKKNCSYKKCNGYQIRICAIGLKCTPNFFLYLQLHTAFVLLLVLNVIAVQGASLPS